MSTRWQLKVVVKKISIFFHNYALHATFNNWDSIYIIPPHTINDGSSSSLI